MADLPFAYQDYSGPLYRGATNESVYVPMRDGVRIAVDLYLPRGMEIGARIPALLIQTRYWRAMGFRRGFGWLGRLTAPKVLSFLARHGYAVVYSDVRGTGASFGTSRHPWDVEEVKDNKDLVDWIVAQPWSNGRVGGYGTSNDGTAAELLTTVNHPAVKAVLPRHNEFDGYADIAYPGGIYLAAFLNAWSATNRLLDANVSGDDLGPLHLVVTGVKPVDADRKGCLLTQAIAEHAANLDIADICSRIDFRDDVDAVTGVDLADFAVYTHRAQIERSGVAIYGWGGWFDAATAGAVIRRFCTLANPQLAIVGPWNHGSTHNCSPFTPVPETATKHWIEYLRFFDRHLKGKDSGLAGEPLLAYYTLGEERWKTTATWPPQGVIKQPWYFAPEGSLAPVPPEIEEGADRYEIDFEATTGTTNRWHTQMTGCPVVYPDRAAADEHLLTYTSSPLRADIEITGHPVVTLYVTSTHSDGAFFVYLEAVDPEGRVSHVTEGQLRALHRQVADGPAPYAVFGPYHSFERKDSLPLVPGELAELAFCLLPTSVRVPAGYRLRVAIAGADRDTFTRIPAEGTPVVHIARDREHASRIELPVAAGGEIVEGGCS